MDDLQIKVEEMDRLLQECRDAILRLAPKELCPETTVLQDLVIRIDNARI